MTDDVADDPDLSDEDDEVDVEWYPVPDWLQKAMDAVASEEQQETET